MRMVLLVQFGESRNSRTYFYYDTITAALDGICSIFEQSLKYTSGPGKLKCSYDLSQLFDYVDSLAEISCLVPSDGEDDSAVVYVPHNKDWLKTQLLAYLKRQLV